MPTTTSEGTNGCDGGRGGTGDGDGGCGNSNAGGGTGGRGGGVGVGGVDGDGPRTLIRTASMLCSCLECDFWSGSNCVWILTFFTYRSPAKWTNRALPQTVVSVPFHTVVATPLGSIASTRVMNGACTQSGEQGVASGCQGLCGAPRWWPHSSRGATFQQCLCAFRTS